MSSPSSRPPSQPPHPRQSAVLWLVVLGAVGSLFLLWHEKVWVPPCEGDEFESLLHLAPFFLIAGLLAQAVWRERRLRDVLARNERDLARRTDQLNSADALFRSLADAAPVGIFHADASGRLYVNRRWMEITGLTFEESLGDNWAVVLHPEDRERVLTASRAAMAAGRPWQSEHRLVHRHTGQVHWVFVQGAPFQGADGEPRFVGSITDITEQKMRERMLRTLSVEVAGLPPGEFYQRVVAELSEVCDVEIALVCRLVGESRTRARILAMCVDGRRMPAGEYALTGTPCEKVLSEAFVFYPQNVSGHFPTDHWLRELGAESYAAVPLMDASGRPIGHLAVMSRRPLRDRARVESALQLFSVRTRAELDRESTEARFAALFEFAPDAIVLTDGAGTMRQVNQQVLALFGYSPQELLGQPVEILMPMEQRQVHVRHRERFAAESRPRAMGAGRPNLNARRKDGSIFPADISLGSLKTDEGG